MTTAKRVPKDPDMRGVLPALRRAARDALQLAIQTGTPCYVMRAGKIVDIAARRSSPKQVVPSANKAGRRVLKAGYRAK